MLVKASVSAKHDEAAKTATQLGFGTNFDDMKNAPTVASLKFRLGTKAFPDAFFQQIKCTSC